VFGLDIEVPPSHKRCGAPQPGASDAWNRRLRRLMPGLDTGKGVWASGPTETDDPVRFEKSARKLLIWPGNLS